MIVRPGTRPLRRYVVPLAMILAAVSVGAKDLRSFFVTLGKNQEALTDCRWKTRVEMVLEGRSESVQVFELRHDADGRPVQSPLQGQAEPGRSSKKQRQLRELRADLLALIDEYLSPLERSAEGHFDQATEWQGQGAVEGETRVKARNVRRQGDEVNLWLDTETAVPRELRIVTSTGGEPVKVTAEFSISVAGPFYPSRIVVETELKEKKLVMTIETFDLVRDDG